MFTASSLLLRRDLITDGLPTMFPIRTNSKHNVKKLTTESFRNAHVNIKRILNERKNEFSGSTFTTERFGTYGKGEVVQTQADRTNKLYTSENSSTRRDTRIGCNGIDDEKGYNGEEIEEHLNEDHHGQLFVQLSPNQWDCAISHPSNISIGQTTENDRNHDR